MEARELAAESIYNERCIAVDDSSSWAKYMSISGSDDEEYDIITFQYTEEGLLSVDENREGRAAAFGDDIAIECLATEFKREIYVVQANGSDAMVDGDNCVIFLPHRPRSDICEPPLFLLMKGAVLTRLHGREHASCSWKSLVMRNIQVLRFLASLLQRKMIWNPIPQQYKIEQGQSQDLGIEAPIPISTKLEDYSNVFRKIVNAAEHPHMSILETESGRSRKQYYRLLNRSLMTVISISLPNSLVVVYSEHQAQS